jgi:hypothetical protein
LTPTGRSNCHSRAHRFQDTKPVGKMLDPLSIRNRL